MTGPIGRNRKTEGIPTNLAMKQPFKNRRPRPSEEGYMLVVVIFMMAILILSLSIALPRVRESIQRDREVETMQRGKQYVRAIQLYYRKFNAYPPNVDALVKTNDIRFLRKKYIDPTTGKDEWKAISSARTRRRRLWVSSANHSLVRAAGPRAASARREETPVSTVRPPVQGARALYGRRAVQQQPQHSDRLGRKRIPNVAGGTDTAGNPAASSGTNGTSGTATSGSAFGSSNNPTGNGQSFGGGGIIGFSPQSPKQSILVYKKKNHYNEWEFLYSPQMDQQTIAGGNTGLGGQPASGTTTPVGSTGTTTPITPTTPTSPQQ